MAVERSTRSRGDPRGEAATPTSVLLVDDHPVVLSGFRHVVEDLSESLGIERIHEAGDIVSGYRIFHKLRPGMVVADLSFQDRDLSGLSLIRRMRALQPDVRVLAFSMHDDPVVVSRALESGALGYVLKDAPTATIVEAFTTVRAGRGFLEHRLATKVAMLNMRGHGPPLGTLNARELQILSLLSKGKSYRVIADNLSVSYRTVIGACSSMRQKLGVQTLAELIHVAVSRNKLDMGV
ncbi:MULTISPECIES: response regulator transcription factor [Methylobacterium]|uniref:Transcriptional activator protein ExaE n=1 Tax=Methylobacterium thuringiense TaxID=1003091 RepID=A0ABQ4TN91_9HYPH|nr:MULTISPECIES: response regulator transcription factor [Methylobacterium]TXN19464.1 response regulator transcription factor [Methylobacterium sp. WL9]GJE56082.1 Transcriptional activator protein ExaE [Methylobacterium thuringiense]